MQTQKDIHHRGAEGTEEDETQGLGSRKRKAAYDPSMPSSDRKQTSCHRWNATLGASIGAAVSLLLFGLGVAITSWDILSYGAMPAYLVLVPLIGFEILVCLPAVRRGSAAWLRGGLIGAGIGLVLATFGVLQTANGNDPLGQGLLFIMAPALFAFLVGGGALLGIVVGLGIQLAKGK